MPEEMFEYPIEPAKEELPTTKFPTDPDWIYPKDFDINANIENMGDELLNKYHDLSHIYWNKILQGAELNLRLTELILLHYKIVKEFEKRNQIHFEPINSLDEIHLSSIEYQNYLQNLTKNGEKMTEKSEANLSFSQPTRIS